MLNTIIETNLSNPDLNIPFIAAEIGMSKVSLYIKMKEMLDVSGNDCISRIRMERLAQLLTAQLNTPIVEIAENFGFSSKRYLSTCFKQFKGVSPSEYRDKKSNETDISQ
jgi:AraC-type DNA-binding domain-containing proteins